MKSQMPSFLRASRLSSLPILAILSSFSIISCGKSHKSGDKNSSQKIEKTVPVEEVAEVPEATLTPATITPEPDAVTGAQQQNNVLQDTNSTNTTSTNIYGLGGNWSSFLVTDFGVREGEDGQIDVRVQYIHRSKVVLWTFDHVTGRQLDYSHKIIPLIKEENEGKVSIYSKISDFSKTYLVYGFSYRHKFNYRFTRNLQTETCTLEWTKMVQKLEKSVGWVNQPAGKPNVPQVISCLSSDLMQ